MCQIILAKSPIPKFMEICSVLHNLFHAYRWEHRMVLTSNMLGHKPIGSNGLEDTAASIFRASYPERPQS